MVSVAVTTYNSAPFVIETLESIKAQQYGLIQLIVSDDCSSDNTVELCRNWMVANGERFVSTEIITVEKNTGVSANCNRCIKASRAAWIKFIAGDDILLPNCLEDNMKFAAEYPDAKVIFSQVLLYRDNFENTSLIKKVPAAFPNNLMDGVFDARQQFKLLLLSDRINYTPSYFFNKAAVESVGGYDEKNKLVEDYPMWLKLTQAGFRLYYFHTATVGYRQHSAALNNMADYGLFKPLLLQLAPLKEKYVYPYLPWDLAANDRHILRVSSLFQKAGLNRQTPLLKKLYTITAIYLNPYRYIIFFKRKVLKLGKKNIFYAG
jgi:alpha-1,3-rhamnosyltransferase